MQDGIQMLGFSQNELLQQMSITFTGEAGIDDGGLSREFGSLFLQQFANSGYLNGTYIRITSYVAGGGGGWCKFRYGGGGGGGCKKKGEITRQGRAQYSEKTSYAHHD